MKSFVTLILAALFMTSSGHAQDVKSKDVPFLVKQALQKKYRQAKGVSWEKENGNYEANWGGKSGEDHSVQFTPAGEFLEIVNAIPVTELPKNVFVYVHDHYNAAKITEAGKVTDAQGTLSYEVEVHGKDVLFNENGHFVR